MKSKFIFFSLAVIFSTLSADAAAYHWFTSGNKINTLPTLVNGTTAVNGDFIVFGADGVQLTANPTTSTSLSSNVLFTGSAGTAGDVDVLLGSNFSWTSTNFDVQNYNVANNRGPNMVAGSVVNIKGVDSSNVGNITFSGQFNVSNAVDTTWNISAETSFTGSNDINIGSNNTVNFSNITSWSGSRAVKIGSDSSLTMEYKGSNTWKTFEIKGLTVDGGTFNLSTVSTGRAVMLTGISNINSLSSDASFGYVRLGGTLTISENVTKLIKIANSNFTFDNGGSLIINKENALVRFGVDGLVGLQFSSGCATASLTLGASNTFTALSSNYTNGTTFTITLAGNVLTFGNISSNKIKEIIISDFQDGLIRITDKDSIKSIDLALFTAKQGTNEVELGWKDAGDYMTLVAIPEPAEWAMILGAIAIAFVFICHRTRK